MIAATQMGGRFKTPLNRDVVTPTGLEPMIPP